MRQIAHNFIEYFISLSNNALFTLPKASATIHATNLRNTIKALT